MPACVLYIVVPCYNEEQVLPGMVPRFLDKLGALAQRGAVSPDSRVLFVDDGSRDATWAVVSDFARRDPRCLGVRLSRNRGHQNALLAGLTEACGHCDVTISIDCDGQDDMDAMDRMLDAYQNEGCDIVYGVREDRASDRFLKRFTAQSFYRLMTAMGVESVYNHADYRLVSARALAEFENFHEVNLFLRGMFPLVGFKSARVGYARRARVAGESHYTLGKMVNLAFDGITSLSVRPIRVITGMGLVVSLLSFVGVIWAFAAALSGHTVAGWASTVSIVCFVGGIQILSLGVIGEYIGRIYLETKARPRFIVSERAGGERPE